MNKSLKNHKFLINFHDFFRHEKCIDFFMHFSWKMGSKMEPKSMLKSFSNDFGRSKGRPGPIVNVFWSEKDGKRALQNRCKKMMRNLEASKYSRNTPGILPEYQNQSPLGHQRDDFGAGGEVRRGQAPPGPAISGSDSASQFKTPCTRRGAADVF